MLLQYCSYRITSTDGFVTVSRVDGHGRDGRATGSDWNGIMAEFDGGICRAGGYGYGQNDDEYRGTKMQLW